MQKVRWLGAVRELKLQSRGRAAPPLAAAEVPTCTGPASLAYLLGCLMEELLHLRHLSQPRREFRVLARRCRPLLENKRHPPAGWSLPAPTSPSLAILPSCSLRIWKPLVYPSLVPTGSHADPAGAKATAVLYPEVREHFGVQVPGGGATLILSPKLLGAV